MSKKFKKKGRTPRKAAGPHSSAPSKPLSAAPRPAETYSCDGRRIDRLGFKVIGDPDPTAS